MILGRYYTILALSTVICSISAGASISTFDQISTVIGALRNWINNDLTIVSHDTASIVDEETSVCIILRHHGEVLGVGIANGEKGNPIAFAARIAFGEVRQNTTLMNMSTETRSHIFASISIELELGEKPIPSPSKNLDRFVRTVNQGFDGIAARKGKRWAIRLPAQMRLSPYNNLITVVESLCITVGVHPAIALSRQLQPQDDITLYTIPTITAIGDRDGVEPRILIRGDELVSVASIEQNGLLHIADLLASHLIVCTSKSGSVIGGYQPETGALSPPLATPAIAAMTASALESYAGLEGVVHAQIANRTVSLILEDIASHLAEEVHVQNDVAAFVSILLASNQRHRSDPIKNMYERCRESIISIASDISSGERDIDNPHLFSIIASAITTIALQENDSNLLAIAESTCHACLTQIPLASRVSTIPWIVDAFLNLKDAGSEIDLTPIAELVAIALAAQVIDDNVPDLLGGFALSTPHGLTVDARGIRMIPMLARVSNTSIMGTSRSTILRSLIHALRFSTQLTTRTPRSQRFDNSTITKGGVRAATWDASMPTEATAMALIGVSRAIKAFRIAAQMH